MKDGVKYKGDDVLRRVIPSYAIDIVNVLVDEQIPYNKKISVYVLEEYINEYEYFIQKVLM